MEFETREISLQSSIVTVILSQTDNELIRSHMGNSIVNTGLYSELSVFLIISLNENSGLFSIKRISVEDINIIMIIILGNSEFFNSSSGFNIINIINGISGKSNGIEVNFSNQSFAS